MNNHKDLLKKVANDYSVKKLNSIYEKQVPVPYLGLFKRRAYVICSVVSAIGVIASLYFSQIFLSIVFITIWGGCTAKVSKIDGYKGGVSDGIESGFEYGQISTGLELLQSDDIKNRLYLHLWYLMYGKSGWKPDKDQEDHYKLEEYLNGNIDHKKSEKK